jgi:hypothetical protein
MAAKQICSNLIAKPQLITPGNLWLCWLIKLKPSKKIKSFGFRFLLIFTIIFGLLGSPIYALSQNQLNVLNEGIYFFNTEVGSCNPATTSTALVGSDNITQSFNYFMAKGGLTSTQVAGLLGNLYAESNGLNPNNSEDGKQDPSPIVGVGFGIAQWTTASRQQGLVALANSEQVPPTNLGVQLDYVWLELNGGYSSVLQALEATSDLQTATSIVMNQYEMPSVVVSGTSDQQQQELQNRVNYATAILTLYGASAQSTTTSTTVTTTSSSGCSQEGGSIAGCNFGSSSDPFTTDDSIIYPGIAEMCSRVSQLVDPSSALFTQWCVDNASSIAGDLCHDACEGTVAVAWQFQSYYTAYDEYLAAVNTPSFHPKDTNPPVGAILLYDYVPYDNGDGHAAIYLGNNMAMSTDIGGNGYVWITTVAQLNPWAGGPNWNTTDPGSGYLGWADPGHPPSLTF